ncbi:hypothetical protein B0O99DRAFT_593054 [Bisporella sp. PMI_857]|nr:hypothetical protein B0O99DRAFT_593054 [Bisporella sp. PMI_857]
MSEKPSAPSPAQYLLKTHPHAPAVSPLHLRLHGDGINVAVCTLSSPIYLRWEHVPAVSYSEEGKEIATSWKHPGRAFGLVLSPPRVKYGWEEVLIVENGGDSGFV